MKVSVCAALVRRAGADRRRPSGDGLRHRHPRATVWSAPLVKLGASLTGVTVIVKVCGARVDAAVRRAAVVVQRAP